MSAKTDGRLGYTTTVKDQVDSIEVPILSSRATWIITNESSNPKENSKENFSSKSKSWKNKRRPLSRNCTKKSANECNTWTICSEATMLPKTNNFNTFKCKTPTSTKNTKRWTNYPPSLEAELRKSKIMSVCDPPLSHSLLFFIISFIWSQITKSSPSKFSKNAYGKTNRKCSESWKSPLLRERTWEKIPNIGLVFFSFTLTFWTLKSAPEGSVVALFGKRWLKIGSFMMKCWVFWDSIMRLTLGTYM